MENELIRTAIRVGNSAGVLLPKQWLNSQVKIVLEPLNIEKEVLGILKKEDILRRILGVYIVGSYARGEQTIESDIDVLAVTDDIEKEIKKGKYDIICISKDKLEEQLNKNALPVLAMIKEAKPIINEGLLKGYINCLLNKKNLRFHIETTKSAMSVVKSDIEISKQMNTKISDASAYSLILRLRTLYVIDCIRKNKLWKKNEFLKMVENISGSLNAYERYMSSKNKNTSDYKLPISEAEKLMNDINKKLTELEKWLSEKKG